MAADRTRTLFGMSGSNRLVVACLATAIGVASVGVGPTAALAKSVSAVGVRVSLIGKTSFSAAVGAGAPIGLASRQPPVIQNVGIHGGSGLYLTWTSGVATSYTITRCTDAATRNSCHDYKIRGQSNQFTPPGLTAGTSYCFWVRALNGTARSGLAGPACAVAGGAAAVRVMTYNILTMATDGEKLTGDVIAPWSERMPAVAALIRGADPDVIAIQEGGSRTGSWSGPRQVDTLQAKLGSTYSVAGTGVVAGQLHYFVPGANYVIYRNTEYRPVGPGGYWLIGGTEYSAA